MDREDNHQDFLYDYVSSASDVWHLYYPPSSQSHTNASPSSCADVLAKGMILIPNRIKY